MTLPIPNLDDRRFQDLVDEAKRQIPKYCPNWTDHNVSDPGITLIELFAWMTEQFIYRLNQVPDKNFITFLDLIGAKLEPARPAKGDVTFMLAAAPTPGRRIIIPALAEVATERTETEEAVIFTTNREAEVIPPQLRWVLTTVNTALPEEEMEFVDGNVTLTGTAPLVIWERTPKPENAIYFGFDADISAHVLTLRFDCQAAGIGIDPKNPPWKWEVWLGNEFQWEEVRVIADTTGGMNGPGEVTFSLPYACQPHRFSAREAHTWLRCSPRPKDPLEPGATYVQSPSMRHVEAFTIGISLPVTHAQPVGPEILGTSDAMPAQKFKLLHNNVLQFQGSDEVVQVSVKEGEWETWTRVDDFGDSGPTDKHYTFDPISGLVEFGPSIRARDGTAPQKGAIPPMGATIRVLRYRIGGGIRGNIAENRVKILKTTIPSVASVTNREPITGGLEAQSLDEAKLRAPALLRTRHRAVTADDFEHLAAEVEGVGRVRCLSPDSELPGGSKSPGCVSLLVIPSQPALEGEELRNHFKLHESLLHTENREEIEKTVQVIQQKLRLTDETRERLRQYLDARRLLTARFEIYEPNYVWIMVQANVKPVPKAEPDRVFTAVKTALYRYLHPLYGGDGHGWPFGQPLTIDKVYALIQSVPGVEYAKGLTLFKFDVKGQSEQNMEETQEVIELAENDVITSYAHVIF